MAENFETFQTGFKNIAHHAEQFDKSVGHSELTVRRLIVSLAGAHIGEQLLKVGVAQSAVVTSLKNGFLALEKGTVEIAKTQFNLENQIKSNLRETTALKGTASRQYLNSLKQESLYLQTQLNVSNAQLAVKQSLSKFGMLDFAMMAVTINGVRDLYHTHKLINVELIEANSDIQTRIGLTKAVIRVQQQLGSEIGITKEAARELVHYGYDLQGNFSENLKLMVQLHDGLGMSVTQAGELVAVFDRQLKSPVRDVADAITRVVNDTSLAADQAGRLAVNIGRAVAALRPGMHSDLAAVTELLGKYEGALQELGGQVGQFGDMLSRMTTPEGMAQAGMLGINDPRFLESKDATKQVVDSFAAYAKRVLGDSQGWDRALRLQVVAEQFGTTGQQVNLMIEAVERANNQRSSSITLEQRYREQVRASGQSLERIGKSLRTLMQQAVVPLLEALAPLIGGLASLVETFVQSKTAVYAVTAVMVVALPFMVAKIWSAVTAFTALTVALMTSARAASMRATSESAQMLLPGLGGGAGGGVAKTVASSLPKIVRSLGIIAGAFAVGWTIGEIYNMIERRASRIDPKFISELKRSYDDVLHMTLNRFGASGDTEGIKAALGRARGVYTRRGENAATVEAKLSRLADQTTEAIGRAKFQKEVSESSIESDPATAKIVSDLNKSQAEMIGIADQQRAAALKQIDLQKEQNRQEQEKQDEERRTRRLNQYRIVPGGFLTQAYGY